MDKGPKCITTLLSAIYDGGTTLPSKIAAGLRQRGNAAILELVEKAVCNILSSGLICKLSCPAVLHVVGNVTP